MIDFNEVPDEELFRLCKSGDDDAWSYSYNLILSICTWYKWNLYDEPEDLAQKITMHLIEKAIKQVNEKNKFRNFVKKMTINKIKDSFKSHKKMVSMDKPQKNKEGEDFVSEYLYSSPGSDTVLMRLEIVSAIDAALNKMSIPCRDILTEYFNYKMGKYRDYNELSKVLKKKVGTISAQVTSCMEEFVEFEEIKELNA